MMKKLIAIILCLFVVLAIDAQRGQTVIKSTPTAINIYGTSSDTIVFDLVNGEYDVSVQLIPSLYGSGDSLWFSHAFQLSDHYSDNAWSISTAADTVGSARDSDGIVYYTDFKPLRLRAICVGLSTDTVTVTPYVVYKKHKNE